MSIDDPVRFAEERATDLFGQAVRDHLAQLRDAGLTIDLGPLERTGSAASYQSYMEATVKVGTEVHDVIFFYVVRDGCVVVDLTELRTWLSRTIDEIVADASSDR